MKTDFKSKLDLIRYYADEDDCKALLAQQRWGENPACPHCGNAGKIYVTNRGYKCGEKACAKKFTVTTGTIFHNSKIKLNVWFEAIFVISAHKKGISSHQLARDLGVTQKTAWFILHRIREMLQEKGPQMLSGVVEIDETYCGGKESNKHASKRTPKATGRSTETKAPVLGLVERNGRVVAKPVPNAKKKTLKPIMVETVQPGSTVYTDDHRAYLFMFHGYNHERVNHSKGEYVKGNVHTNTIEGFWSQFKRGIIGVYHQISPKHLAAYCNEFTYRYNTRKQTDSDRFFLTLSRSDNFTLPYKKLIGK